MGDNQDKDVPIDMEEGDDHHNADDLAESTANSTVANAGDSSAASVGESSWMTSVATTSSGIASLPPISSGPRHQPDLFRLPEGTPITSDFIREQRELLEMAVSEGEKRLHDADIDHAQVSMVDCN